MHQPWYRGYAYKELTTIVRDEYAKYKEFVITKAQSSPYIYFMFYNKIDPVTYQKQGSPRDLAFSGFDKYRFSQVDCPLSGGKTLRDDVVGKVGVLYVNKGTCPVPTHSVKVIKTINWQDNNPAFMLLEYVPPLISP